MSTYNKWGRFMIQDDVEELEKIVPSLYPACLLCLACQRGTVRMIKYLLQFFKVELYYLSYVIRREDEHKEDVANIIINRLYPPFSEVKVKEMISDCRFWGEYKIAARLRQKLNLSFVE